MASALYMPIIKGKLGEVVGLGSISSNIRAGCKPLIELMPRKTKKPPSIDEHVFNFCELIRKHLPLGEIYADMFGLMPEDATSDGVNAVLTGFNILRGMGRYVTPVYGLERNDEIWTGLGEVARHFGRGFAFRLTRDDIASAQTEETWAQIIERSAQMGLHEAEIDLILDLKHIGDEAYSVLSEQTIAFLFSNSRVGQYRSIIVAGSSALKDVSDIEKEESSEVIRSELHLWARLWVDMPDDVKPLFGDYGIVHPDFFDQGSSKYMNAKIRYTVGDRIVYYRGRGLHMPVTDYNQYHSLAAKVMSDDRYQGQSCSEGDDFIAKCAGELVNPGTPRRWVTADTNHHISYTTRQVAKLVATLQQVEVEQQIQSAVLEV